MAIDDYYEGYNFFSNNTEQTAKSRCYSWLTRVIKYFQKGVKLAGVSSDYPHQVTEERVSLCVRVAFTRALGSLTIRYNAVAQSGWQESIHVKTVY